MGSNLLRSVCGIYFGILKGLTRLVLPRALVKKPTDVRVSMVEGQNVDGSCKGVVCGDACYDRISNFRVKWLFSERRGSLTQARRKKKK